MHWIDWLIVAVPLVVVTWLGLRTQRYVKGVSDFLTAGRVAGRYVLCVSGGEAGMGLISLVAVYESYYESGFAYGFWGSISAPIFIVLGLTGFCVYRFRETRAMTVGQFLEIRYSRRFRVFAGILQSISGVVNYALFPAVGARFLVYFCGLPVETNFFGWIFPTFALLMAIFLGLAVLIAWKGGQITIMVTNCVQGLLSYPIYVVIVAYVLFRFSWFNDMAPVLLDRAPGKSLINPFDITGLRDFNLFYVVIGILGGCVNRLGWSGNQGYSVAARNAHEQKISAVLGSWRSGFESMMYLLLAIVGMTYLNSDRFQAGPLGAAACRTELAVKVVNDVASTERLAPVRQEVINYLNTGTVTPVLQGMLDKTAALKAKEEADRDRLRRAAAAGTAQETAAAADAAAPAATNAAEARQLARETRVQTARDAIQSVDPSAAQTFGTIFAQMRVPMALRYILPIGITGLFCAICIFLMVSTDTSYILSWASIIAQDVVLPFRRKPFTPKQQLALLRWLIAGVAVFAFFFSYFFGQVDYVLMFFAITGAIWLGGSGPCITGGLYWKRGTAAGAWAALISGSGLAVAGILLQKYWVGGVYPWLHAHGLVDTVGLWLERASAPFEPLIKWRMSSEKFPINSQEVYAIGMLVSIGLYVVISLIASRGGRVFNMDRMLHRGIYHREGVRLERPVWTFRNVLSQLIGIDNQYTRGDKILAWSVFIWSFVWGFLCSFVGVAIWNFISPWGNDGWSRWFFFNNFILAGAIGVVSTVWFTIGCTLDLRRLFKDLALKETNVLDDGRVVGHVSADDLALVDQVEQGSETAPGDERPSAQK
jgi:Na+/proline symporter